MSDIQYIFQKTIELEKQISELFRESNYETFNDLNEIEVDLQNKDELFLKDQLTKIFDHFDDAKRKIEYLERKIQWTGIIKMNSCGKYETENGHSYSCGQTIEAYIYVYDGEGKWIVSRIEHNRNKGYFIYGYPEVELENLKVRLRI